MVKNIIKFISFVIILIISVSLYLSYFGIETSKFNSEIKKQIKNKYDFVDLNFSKIKLLLRLRPLFFRRAFAGGVFLTSKEADTAA